MNELFERRNLYKNLSLTGYLSLVFSLFLTGCGLLDSGTPTVHAHAKRGYNKPYQVKGTWYHPQKHYEYSEVGKASHYGQKDGFHGKKTSTGERFNAHGLTAAHPVLPIPSVVRVTNLDNGRSLKLKVIDRGPFVNGRIIDVSSKAAKLLGFYEKGITDVRVECLVSESIYLAQTYNPNKSSFPSKSQKIKLHNQPTTYLARKEKISPFKLVSYKGPNPQKASSKKAGAVNGVFVDMGVYSNAEKAQKLVQLTRKKFRVPVKSYRYNKNKRQYYRVLVGPFNSSENASNLLHQIHSHGYRSAVVVYE